MIKNLFISNKEDKQPKNIVKKTKNPYDGSVVLDKIYNFLDDKNELPSWASPAMHASSLGYMCSRQETFKRILPRKQIKRIAPHTRIIFDIGHAVHTWWQDNYLGPMGVLYGDWECSRCWNTVTGFMPNKPCEKCTWLNKTATVICKDSCRWPNGYESPLRACYACRQWGAWHYKEPHFALKLDKTGLRDRRLTGFADGIIHSNDEQYILDLKTISASRIKKLEEPFRAHTQQVMAYMKGFDINKAILIYIPKDDNNKQPMKEFVINFDAAIWHKTEILLENIIRALNAGELPVEGPCETPADGIKKECVYVDECFKKGKTFDKETLDLYFSLIQKEVVINE